MICHEKCPSISTYGFVAHSECVRAKECVVSNHGNGDNPNSGITCGMLPYLPSLKSRVCGSTMYAIKNGIPGVFPKMLSLWGYTRRHQEKIAEARGKAAVTKLANKKKKQMEHRRRKEHGDKVEKEIEICVEKSISQWKAGWKVADVEKEVFERRVRFFKTGDECLAVLYILQTPLTPFRHVFNKYELDYILYKDYKNGGLIDTKSAISKILKMRSENDIGCINTSCDSVPDVDKGEMTRYISEKYAMFGRKLMSVLGYE